MSDGEKMPSLPSDTGPAGQPLLSASTELDAELALWIHAGTDTLRHLDELFGEDAGA